MDEFCEMISEFPCYSDLNFTSLISWSEKVMFAKDDESITIVMEDYSSSSKVITGISRNPDKFLRELIGLQKSIPNSIVDLLPGVMFTKSTDEQLKKMFQISYTQSDYIYIPKNQLNMEGHIFAWHRRKLSHVRKGGYEIHLDIAQEIDEGFLDLYLHQWKKWKLVKNVREEYAINRYIQYFPELKNQFIVNLSLNGSIEAFAFCEFFQSDHSYLIIHFFKSNTKFEGLSNYLFHEIAQIAHDKEVDFINFEQDLGEEGLKYYKQHLRPDLLLDKYYLNSAGRES